MFDMMGMMGKMKDIQAKMKEAQDNIGLIEEEAEAGAGMVKVKVNGNKKLLSVEIEPELLTVADKEMLQDLIVAAINKANEAVQEKAKQQIEEQTKGMLPPGFPGLDGLFK